MGEGPTLRRRLRALPVLAFALGSCAGFVAPWSAAGVTTTAHAQVAAPRGDVVVPSVASGPSPRRPAIEEVLGPSEPTDDPDALPRLNPEATVGRAWALASGPRNDDPHDGRRVVTFTFDDGPFLETTPRIARTLAHYKVHGAFFVLGRYLEGNGLRARRTRALVRELADAGHLIGNHTRDHRLLTSLTHARAVAQIDDAEAQIARAIGRRPVLFRPPYGQVDPFIEQTLAARHAELVLWSIEAGDMQETDADQLFASLTAQIERAGGGIVLLHDIRPVAVAVLPRLLEWLRARRWDPAQPARIGYDVIDLPAYLRATAARPRT